MSLKRRCFLMKPLHNLEPSLFVCTFIETCSPYHSPEANNNIVLSGSSGRLLSPLFPLSYHINMKCRWTITVPSGHRIKFTFEAFHLGSKGLDNCEKVDHVEVRDSYNENDPAYGTFCGNVAPAPIYSVGPKMEVTFVSDEERVFQGFSARFDTISGGKNSYSETSAHSILARAWSMSGGVNFPVFARFLAIAKNSTLNLQIKSDSRQYDLMNVDGLFLSLFFTFAFFICWTFCVRE